MISNVPRVPQEEGKGGLAMLAEMKAIAKNKVREKAVDALAEIQGAQAQEFLEQFREAPYGGVRDAAGIWLTRLGAGEETGQFLQALGSEDEGVRLAAASALNRICDKTTSESLRGALKKEKTAEVKLAILDALSCTADESAVPEITAAAADANSLVRLKALNALGALKSPAAMAKIKQIYGSNKDIYARVAAVKYLADSGEETDIKIIEEALRFTDRALKIQALSALDKIPGDASWQMLSGLLNDKDMAVQVKTAVIILRRFRKSE